MPPEYSFTESQKFKQVGLWIVFIGLNGLFAFGVIKQVFTKEAFGNKPLPSFVLVLLFLIVLAFTLFFRSLRLDTKIDAAGISVRFWPIQSAYKLFPWDKIEGAYIRTYKPIGEFGGWGIRGDGRNRALNMSGNVGIQLSLRDGKNLLIGTHKAAEVAEILVAKGYAQKGNDFS